MAYREKFLIPVDWFEGREEINMSDLSAVVPCSDILDLDTLLEVFSQSALQIQHRESLSLKRLRVHDSVGVRGLKAIASMIHRGLLGNLQLLSIHYDWYVAPVACAVICKALQSGKVPDLSTLDFLNFDFSNEDNLNELAEALQSGQLRNLLELKLQSTQINGNRFVRLADALRSGKVGNLMKLDLRGNKFGDEGAMALAQALKFKEMHNLEFLDLADNRIDDRGAVAIIEALKLGEVSNLAAATDRLGRQEAIAPAEAPMVRKVCKLKNLCLGRNWLGNRAALAIAEALQSGEMSNLEYLSLRDNKILYEGVIALAEALKSGGAARLQRVSLYKNIFSDKGYLHIAKALEAGVFPPSLSTLELFDDSIHFSSVDRAFVNAYKSNRRLTMTLTKLSSSGNFHEYQFSALTRALEELRLSNLEWAKTVRALSNHPQVPATYAKAFLCGRPHVGKTTLRRTLVKRGTETGKSVLKHRVTETGKRVLKHRVTGFLSKHEKLLPTRGIEVSHVPGLVPGHGGSWTQSWSKGESKTQSRTEIAIWDLAGQWEFEVLHSTFLPDIGLADGPGVFFVIICSENMPRGSPEEIPTSGGERTPTSGFVDATEKLGYWLRFISSHSLTAEGTEPNTEAEMMAKKSDFAGRQQVRKVFVVINCYKGEKSDRYQKERWRAHLNVQRETFKDFLNLCVTPFVLDARNIKAVEQLEAQLNEEVQKVLEQYMVPKICITLLQRCQEWLQDHHQYPVLQWEQYSRVVGLESDNLLKAATNYLHETGHLIWFKDHQGFCENSDCVEHSEENSQASGQGDSSEIQPAEEGRQPAEEGSNPSARGNVYEAGPSGRSSEDFEDFKSFNRKRDSVEGVVILSPEYFCQNIVGHLLLPDHLLKAGEVNLKALYKDPCDDSLPLATIAKEHFLIPQEKCKEMVNILMRLGLGYSHSDDPNRIYVPAVIDKKAVPSWLTETGPAFRRGTTWTMGFSLKPRNGEQNLLPVTILRELQVHLAYDRQIGCAADSEFRADVSQIWFKWKKMGVLVEYSAPEYLEQDRLDVIVRPLAVNSDACYDSVLEEETQLIQRQAQVGVAHQIVQRVLLLATKNCPGLQLERRVIKPWSCTDGLHKLINRDVTMSAEAVMDCIKENGVDGILNWTVGNTFVKYVDILAMEDFQQVEQSYKMRVDFTVSALKKLGFPDPPQNLMEGPKLMDTYLESASSSSRSRASGWQPDPQTVLILDALDEKMEAMGEKISRQVIGMEERLSSKLQGIKVNLFKLSKHQESLIRYMLSLETFLVQDKEKSVPRFAYLARLQGRNKVWMKISEGFAERVSLHFLCEARFEDGKLHEVEQQLGVDITKIRKWVKKLIPVLDWTLKLAFVAAKIANGAVLPGLATLFEGNDTLRNIMNSSSQMANGISDLGKLLYEQFSVVPGALNVNMVSGGQGSACRKEGLDFVRQILSEYDPHEFQKLVGLRKVKFCHSSYRDKDMVAWICNQCCEDYGPNVVDLGSSCR